MNTYDIDNAVENFKSDPILGPAAKYLRDYRDLVDANSDGWAYWHYGTKCSKPLQTILEAARLHQIRGWEPDFKPATTEQGQAACRKIHAFILRCEQWKNKGVQPPSFDSQP